jgi:hypothetical protein
MARWPISLPPTLHRLMLCLRLLVLLPAPPPRALLRLRQDHLPAPQQAQGAW